jgi:hypothetical protein
VHVKWDSVCCIRAFSEIILFYLAFSSSVWKPKLIFGADRRKNACLCATVSNPLWCFYISHQNGMKPFKPLHKNLVLLNLFMSYQKLGRYKTKFYTLPYNKKVNYKILNVMVFGLLSLFWSPIILKQGCTIMYLPLDMVWKYSGTPQFNTGIVYSYCIFINVYMYIVYTCIE